MYDYVITCGSLKGKISQMEVLEDFELRPHKAASFLVEREKEMQEWNEGVARLPGRSPKEKRVRRGQRERNIRQEIAREVAAGIKEKASAHDDAKATA